MAESKRRPRSLKGAVLIMVVTILFVLIVMLLATLAVVSSTSQRTYTKYEEAQSYYTARSVLEVYINEFLQEKTEYTNISHLENAMKEGGFTELTQKDPADGKFKDGFQKVGGKYYDFTGSQEADNVVSVGFAHQQEIFGYLTPRYGYTPDPAATKLEDKRNWTAVDEKKIGDKYWVEFESTVPGLSAVGENSKGFDTDGKVTIRVELHRVLYKNKDGQILTDCVGSLDNNASDIRGTAYPYAATASAHASGPDAKHNGLSTGHKDGVDTPAYDNVVDWEKTYYRIKVTATANISDTGSKTDPGSEVSVSVLLEPNPVLGQGGGSSNAMTSFAQSSPSQHLFTIGGASASAPGYTMGTRNESIFNGTYIYRTNVEFSNGNCGKHIYIPFTDASGTKKAESLVIQGGSMKITQNNMLHVQGHGNADITNDPNKLNERPFIYMCGFYVDTGNNTIGRKDAACDVIISAYDADVMPGTDNGGGGLCDIIGDVDSANPDGHKLAFYANSDNGPDIFGNLYVDGDMYMSPKTRIHGNVFCTGTVYMSYNSSEKPIDGDLTCADVGTANITVTTNVISWWPYQATTTVNATYNKGDGDGNALCGGTYTQDTSPTWEIRATDWFTGATDGVEHETYTAKLPGTSGNNVERVIRSVNDIKSTYTYAANAATCSSLGIAPSGSRTVDDPVTAEEWFKINCNNADVKLTVDSGAPKLKSKVSGTKTLPGGVTAKLIKAEDCSASAAVSGLYQAKMSFSDFANDNSTYYIDTTGGSIQIEIEKGSCDNCRATFVIGSANSASFTFKGDGDLTTNKMDIYTEELYERLKTGDHKMALGDHPVESADYKKLGKPNINFYFGGGENGPATNPTNSRKIFLYNGNNSQTCGYIYMPYDTYSVNAQPVGPDIKWTYNGEIVKENSGSGPSESNGSQYGTKDIGIYGSLVTYDFDCQNDFGIVYINAGEAPKKSAGGAGGNINWGRMQYFNS